MDAAASLNLSRENLLVQGTKRAGGVVGLHALTGALDRVPWADEVELARGNLHNLCLVWVTPNHASKALENEHPGRGKLRGTPRAAGMRRLQWLRRRAVELGQYDRGRGVYTPAEGCVEGGGALVRCKDRGSWWVWID